MKTARRGKPPTRFLAICPHINEAYAELRVQVRDMGYVAQGNNGSSVEQYALGYIREIAAQHLPLGKVEDILAQFSDRRIWSSAGHMQVFVPVLVREAIVSGVLTAPQFVERINDQAAFKKFADEKKVNPGNRASNR